MADEEKMETSAQRKTLKPNHKKKKKKPATQDSNSVFIPGRENIGEHEELTVDESAYVMLHQATTGDPCLSFEILKDEVIGDREKFPLTSYLVGGTQSESGHYNYVLLMKMDNMHKTQKLKKDKEKSDSESEESDESDNDDEEEALTKTPHLTQTMIRHAGCVNKVKSTVINQRTLAVTWSELGVVNIYDVSQHIQILDTPNQLPEFEAAYSQLAPTFSFSGHGTEGYALAWSKNNPGRLLSGDCNKNVYMWVPSESTWEVDPRPFVGHTASVEDIKWSPKESNVFMTCSVDKSLRVWDARVKPSKACKLVTEAAHNRDINVIDWSEYEPLVISGCDDGLIKVWDLRRFTTGTPAATFNHHHGAISSVEWNPMDSSVFIASGSDDQVSIWDLAVERDDSGNQSEELDIPQQLLFIHMGQKDIKEVHWHPQSPGLIISTAQSGFNVFRTISV